MLSSAQGHGEAWLLQNVWKIELKGDIMVVIIYSKFCKNTSLTFKISLIMDR